jgi:alpha-mannosidase
VIGLSMLKSAVYPNPEADKEHHSFTWSICPHEEGWRQGETVAKAYLLNNPYQGMIKENEGGTLPQCSSFVKTDQSNIVIEALKKAEDSDDMVIRLYECYNRRGKAALEFAKPVRSAVICNMLEENEAEPIQIDGCRVEFYMNPYEIKTIKIKLA